MAQFIYNFVRPSKSEETAVNNLVARLFVKFDADQSG